jgi:hypothetical protein
MNNQIVDFERKKLNILHSLPLGDVIPMHIVPWGAPRVI